MKHRVLPVLLQAFLLAAVANLTLAQSPQYHQLPTRPSRSVQILKHLSPEAVASAQFGLQGIMRQSWDGTGWVTHSQTIHSYNGLARTETLDQDWNIVQWLPSTRTRYRVDGLVESIEQWSPTHNDYLPVTRFAYSFLYDLYSGEASLSEIVTQVWNGVDWENSERTVYVVDKIDPSGSLLIVGGTDEAWDGSAWTPSDDFVIEQVGDDVIETSRFWDAGSSEWVNLERTTFRGTTIPALHERLNQLVKEFSDFGELTLALLMIPDYESDIWMESPGEWMADSRRITDQFHFPSGKPAVVLHQRWDGLAWNDELRHEVTYSVEGRIETSEVTYQENGGSAGFLETYTHDDRGLISDVWTNVFDGGISLAFARYLMSWTELVVGVDGPGELPSVHRLKSAYPNPFNPSTTLSYDLAGSDRVKISVHDILGKTVAIVVDGTQAAGSYSIQFDAKDLPSGLYAVRMQTSQGTESRTITLLK